MAVTENTTTVGSVVTTTRTGTATAQVSPAGSPNDAIHASGTVNVNEVKVSTDMFVLDPSHADAVQIPDAGRSPLEADGLPIARLTDGVPDFSDPEQSGG